MCEYCGCRDIPLIGRLSEEHYEAVDGLGALRRAIDSGDQAQVEKATADLAAELFVHNDSEEAGLFAELEKDEYFAPTIAELKAQHVQFREFVSRITAGDWDAYHDLEHTLRHHIDREENGLFPATAVAVDGPTWAEIDRLTHAFNVAHDREHAMTEAELQQSLRAGGAGHHHPHEHDHPHDHDHGHDHDHPHHDHPHDHSHDHDHAEERQASPLAPDVAAVEASEDFGAAAPTGPGVPAVLASLPPDAGEAPYTVRPATKADAAQLVALWRQCGLGAFEPDVVAKNLASVAALHPELGLVAVSGDSIVASALGTWDGRRGWLNRVATRPDRRGEGIATALVRQIEDAVRALGGGKLDLMIEADAYPVIGFFEKLGYATEDLIFMERPL